MDENYYLSPPKCSFCTKPVTEVGRLIRGVDVRICNECITLCSDIMSEDSSMKTRKKAPLRRMYPKVIKSYLDDHIIGQHHAKQTLSVAIYNHYKRITQTFTDSEDDNFEEELQSTLTKGNILLIGPTGSGKTLMAKTIAKKLDVPFTIADATSLTEAGYVGEDVENIVKNLWLAAGRDVERTKQGIICIDEIDKLGSKSSSSDSSRDVGGEGVQQALLKMVESSKVMISPDGSRNRPQQDLIPIDTTNILFICCGSFEGLDDLIARRLGESRVGFNSDTIEKVEKTNQILRNVHVSDLNKFGLIPEFIGRFPVIVTFDELDADSLVQILWKPRNSLIAQYQKLLEIEGVKLHFEHDALMAMVQRAIERKTGARGLRAIIEEVMLDVMYDIPSLTGVRECIITADCITKKTHPTLVFEKTPA